MAEGSKSQPFHWRQGTHNVFCGRLARGDDPLGKLLDAAPRPASEARELAQTIAAESAPGIRLELIGLLNALSADTDGQASSRSSSSRRKQSATPRCSSLRGMVATRWGPHIGQERPVRCSRDAAVVPWFLAP